MAVAIIDYKNNIVIPEVTVADFIARYGLVEALEISQLHDPNATIVDEARIEVALYDAQCWLHSTLMGVNVTGRELITSSAKRYVCSGARYLLDSLRRRAVVVEEWEELNREIARFATEANRLSKWRNASGNGSNVRIGHQRRVQYDNCTMHEWRELGENDGSYYQFPDLVLSKYYNNAGGNSNLIDCDQNINSI